MSTSRGWGPPGIGHVAEYQASGYTFCVPTGSGARTVELNYVSRAITISASASTVAVEFFADDNSSSTFTFAGGAGTVRFEVKCKKFAFSGAGNTSAVVECTNIPADTNAFIPGPAKLGKVT